MSIFFVNMIRCIFKIFVFVSALSGLLHGCFRETPVEVVVDFTVEIVNNDYSVPVILRVSNKTVGADLYKWSFEGETPFTSSKVTPEEIVYERAGNYIIRLEAWNSTERKFKEICIQLDSALSIGFTPIVRNNNFSPVAVDILSDSRGGTHFYWKFEGGKPETSEVQHPPVVLFTEPGNHTIRLKVSNGRETMEVSEVINVLPALTVNFDWSPCPGNEDMEAPFTAWLTNKTQNALSYRWIAEKGMIISARQ